ncbi:hypothetical protein PoB_007660300 [Plakobranchus ocellatus]|uniref:Uncharacterized protein n=1 Tax=Plakobranchus ocellatus TaxID=259542 RepID=A0AAV4E0H8_9GAST|nr:hypothetical protein PoB_007660300 [Plakobranchus ocellatus]
MGTLPPISSLGKTPKRPTEPLPSEVLDPTLLSCALFCLHVIVKMAIDEVPTRWLLPLTQTSAAYHPNQCCPAKLPLTSTSAASNPNQAASNPNQAASNPNQCCL